MRLEFIPRIPTTAGIFPESPHLNPLLFSPAGRGARASGSEGKGVGWGEEGAQRQVKAGQRARQEGAK
jgi:hypothetical protein